jgi:hypothetical protein
MSMGSTATHIASIRIIAAARASTRRTRLQRRWAQRQGIKLVHGLQQRRLGIGAAVGGEWGHKR